MACKYKINNQVFNSKEELKEYFSQRKNITKDIIATFGGNTSTTITPYKGTDMWVGVAFRRILKLAVDEGYSGVALATGQQSADMYSLSNQVDKININPQGEIKAVYISMKNNADDTVFINQEGVITESASGAYNGKQAEEVLGKDLTKKILETTEDTTLEGEGLEFGGEGMKTFYDKIVPKVVQKEAQRFDKNAKLETVDFGEGLETNIYKLQDVKDIKLNGRSLQRYLRNADDSRYLTIDDLQMAIVDDMSDLLVRNGFENIEDAKKAAEKGDEDGVAVTRIYEQALKDHDLLAIKEIGDLQVQYYENAKSEKDKLSLGVQPYLPLTQSIKDSVSQGIPQFQKNGITLTTNGFTYKNDVYLNKETATDNTKVHEFSHLYTSYLKKNKLELYNKGLDLVKAELGKNSVTSSISKSNNPSFDSMLDFNTEGGILEIGRIKGRDIYSVLHLKVDENFRRQGIASKLLKEALNKTNGNLSGQASNDAAVELNYKLGMRAYKNEKELSLEESKSERAKSGGESIRMILPESLRGENYKPFVANISEIQDIIDFVKTNQPNLKGESLFEEILTELVGRKGAQILESKSSLGKLLEEIWNEIKNLLGLSQYSTEQVMNMTLQKYSDAVAVDLIRGEKLKQNKGFNEAVEEVAKNANEYKTSKGIKGVASQPLYEIDASMSQEIAKQYEEASVTSNSQAVKDAYEALEKETIEQYDFILSKGLKVEKYEGVGEPYKNSKEMLSDIRDNNTLKFLPNEGAFGQESESTDNRIGLQPSGRVLDNGYEMTLSEVFRVVHDYFGHGILGNQFGAIGEENATLQHLDLYSAKALPAVVFQTRGQNSWVNYSGANTEAKELQKQAKEEKNAEKLAESEKMFKFAEPKDNIFPPIYNFKRYETVRRIQEQRENEKQEQYIDPRTRDANISLSAELSSNVEKSRSTRGVSRRGVQGTRSIQQFELEVIAEYELDQAIDKGIKKAFPTFKGVQKILEVTDGKAFRELMIESLNDNPFKSSVTVHTAEEFSQMRMFITEDGSTGITLTKEGFLGGAWSNPNANRPSNLSQLLVLGIKEGALIAEAFDTVLPDMYADYGLKAVSRTPFDEAQRPLVENGALEDWDYDKYKRFSNGRPDVVFFIYDGGSRDTIEDRLGQFDRYQEYQKEQTVEMPYEEAYKYMEVAAVNKENYNSRAKGETVEEVYNNLKENMGRTTLEDVLKAEKEMGTEKTIEYLKKCR